MQQGEISGCIKSPRTANARARSAADLTDRECLHADHGLQLTNWSQNPTLPAYRRRSCVLSGQRGLQKLLVAEVRHG